MESEYLKKRREILLGIRPPDEKKAAKPIPKKSAKIIEQDKKYKKVVKELMDKTDKCQVSSPVCVVKASGLHHVQKRSPKNVLDKKNVIRACSPCNLWIEENPTEAKILGFTISRFKK